MPSTIFSSSDATLLTKLSERNLPNHRSRSKRLYTFIHYEHSTHPRRYIILFFIIIFVTLSIAWLIAGLIRLRETASYLESCADGKVQCLSGADLICSPTSLTCLCPEQTFWDDNIRKCSTVKTINGTCSTNQQCETNKGLICHRDGTCQCPPNTYYTITRCESK